MLAAIAPAPSDRFLEIGPGPGVLTSRLAARAASVTAVEIDRDLASHLRQTMPPNVAIVTGDILDVDLLVCAGGAPLRIAGNLPYNISSPILFKLFQSVGDVPSRAPGPRGHAGAEPPGPPISDATLMLQREVADRLAARPGTKDYGVLTIFTAAHADVERLLTLPPGAFRPTPKVHSAVVRLRFVPVRIPAEIQATFERMVRMMFTQRRKMLGNALRPFAESLGRDAGAALSAAGIDAAARPETLDLAALTRLAAVFGRA